MVIAFRRKTVLITIATMAVAILSVILMYKGLRELRRMAEASNKESARLSVFCLIILYRDEHPEVPDFNFDQVAAWYARDFGEDFGRVGSLAAGPDWRKEIVVVRHGTSVTASFNGESVYLAKDNQTRRLPPGTIMTPPPPGSLTP